MSPDRAAALANDRHAIMLDVRTPVERAASAILLTGALLRVAWLVAGALHVHPASRRTGAAKGHA